MLSSARKVASVLSQRPSVLCVVSSRASGTRSQIYIGPSKPFSFDDIKDADQNPNVEFAMQMRQHIFPETIYTSSESTPEEDEQRKNEKIEFETLPFASELNEYKKTMAEYIAKEPEDLRNLIATKKKVVTAQYEELLRTPDLTDREIYDYTVAYESEMSDLHHELDVLED
eukprot:scpid106251/ scgid35139/ 